MDKSKKDATGKVPEMDNFKEDETEKLIETNIFKKDPTKKVLELGQEMKQKFLDKIEEEFADNYFKEIPEKNWLHQIIEIYCSNFTEKVKIFLSFVKKFKLNDIIKKVKIGLAIGGGILAVGGVIAASVVFPLAPAAAAAAVIPAAGFETVGVVISGAIAGATGTVASTAAWFSRRKKTGDFENFSFHLIPPEKFVKEKIIFKTYIGQIIHPLNIPDN